jgi:hypothetical protein
MSDTTQGRVSATGAAPGPDALTRPRASATTAWVGWVIFAGVMMIMLGSFQAIEGLVAIFDDTYYLVTHNGLLVSADYTVWGWTHLAIGVLMVVAGFAVMRGQMWARAVGVVLAVISALVNLAFLAAYPIWSTIIIALDVVVIYAIVVHGSEAKQYDL